MSDWWKPSHIEEAINIMARNLSQNMNDYLYGDGSTKSDLLKPWTRRERIIHRLQLFRGRILMIRHRIGDAWLVLTGQAYIDE